MATLDDVTDYIITKVSEAGVSLNVLKLHKLLYYCQAWRLAHEHKPLFIGEFQAWVHGPVSRQLYDRFKDSKNLYANVSLTDRRPGFDGSTLTDDERAHIDSVVEAYGKYTGSQLEELTHREEPWTRARGSLGPAERSEFVIDEELMGTFYRSRVGDE